VREAPAIVIVRELLEAGAHVRAYDPKAAETAAHALGGHDRLTFVDRHYECAEGCDALVLCTEWSFFRNADLERVKQLLKTPVVFDGRNVYRPDKMRKLGFDYFSIGRAPVRAYSRQD